MPITTLDPLTALIVVDLQNGIVDMPLAHPIADVIERTTTLLHAFRSRGLPVVLVNVAGAPPGRTDAGHHATRLADGSTQLLNELDQQPDDILVTKRARSAFTQTGLTEHLRDLGVTQIVVTGIATSSGVESTARDAHEQGFSVILPIDATTDRALASHEHSATRVFPRIAETGTTQDVLDILARRS